MGITTVGDTVIGDILDQDMILLPLAIDPLGRFGPILQHFLFAIQPASPLTFTPAKHNTTSMYSKLMCFPSPKGVLNLANHNWKTTQSHQFCSHSYSAQPPLSPHSNNMDLLSQKHIRYVMCRFHNHSFPTPPLSDPILPILVQTGEF